MNPNLCQNGKCANVVGSFACRCEDGYSVKSEFGPGCTDDDECSMGTFLCDPNAECNNIDGTYNCQCRDGFTGELFTKSLHLYVRNIIAECIK